MDSDAGEVRRGRGPLLRGVRRRTFAQERLVRAGLVAVLLSGVAVATLGAGYRSSDALMENASAFLQRDHDVVRVNAESQDVDAESARELATGEERLEVVQVSPGVTYVVNNDTGAVWRMPTDTMEPEQVRSQPDAGQNLEVVAGGDRAYLLNIEDHTLSLLEDKSGVHETEVVLPAQAKVDAVVVDSGGIAWALSSERGELYAVDGVTVVAQLPVAEPDAPAELTLAGDRPVVYLPEQGVAAIYDREGRRGGATLPAESGVNVEVAAAGADVPVLATLVRRTSELITVDIATGETDRVVLFGREGHDFGPPVVAGGRVYVPDYTDHHVIVVRLDPLREVSHHPVPGNSDEFALFTRGDRVWVNDPYAPRLLSFGQGGRPSLIDKGTGKGEVAGEDRPEPDRPPAPATGSPIPPPPPSSPPERPEEPVEVPGQPVEVPDVIGLDRLEACQELKNVGLACEFVRENTDEGQSGEVLRTLPRAGDAISVGGTVEIVFRAPPLVTVPDEEGTRDATCAAVQAAGLICDDVPAQNRCAESTAEAELVVSYEPAAGTEVERGEAVRVEFLGPCQTYAVPDVVRMHPDAACQALVAVFLQCVRDDTEAHWETYVVHSQDVAAGRLVPPGTPVVIVYAGGPDPVRLTRYRYKGPNGDRPAWYLSINGSPGMNWKIPKQFGGVYGPQGGRSGLVTVYRTVCQVVCGMPQMWYFAAEPSAPARPAAPVGGQTGACPSGCWSAPEPAFTCFANPQPGTAPLMRMYNPDREAWTFAVQGTGEHQYKRAERGYTDEYPICHIWYGVGPFPAT